MIAPGSITDVQMATNPNEEDSCLIKPPPCQVSMKKSRWRGTSVFILLGGGVANLMTSSNSIKVNFVRPMETRILVFSEDYWDAIPKSVKQQAYNDNGVLERGPSNVLETGSD